VDGRGKSDSPIIPGKPPNKGRGAPRLAEAVEERGLAKGNPVRHDRDRAQDRVALQSALDRVRQAASNDRELRFTTLWHHVYDIRRLCEAYFSMKRDAAAGVDGQTWRQYGEALESHLEDLSDRLRRGGYRAKPVRRAFIPKADGGQRPLGVPVLEDKIVQRATAEVLNAIYETDFVGFSYGFRPGRSPHNALDAVSVGITRRKVSWVLDADIRGFYDAVDHEWLVKFVEHRIADRRVVRHVKKWLKAGVMEDGERRRVEEGTPQGSSVSPILSNLYLHHVFDLWAQRWRQKHARGEMIVVRFADDIIAGFQYKSAVLGGHAGAFPHVQPGAAPRQDAPDRVRSVRGPGSGEAGSGEARDLRLPRIHAYLREEEERQVRGASADDEEEAAGEGEGREDGASHPPARSRSRSGEMVGLGGAGARPVLRCAPKQPGDQPIPAPGDRSVVSQPEAAKPEDPIDLEPDVPAGSTLDPLRPDFTPLPGAASVRLTRGRSPVHE